MKRNKVILFVITISLAFFSMVIVLLSIKVIEPDFLTSKLFSVVIPLGTGVVVGATFIIGYFYLTKGMQLKKKYRTLPVYGFAVILEAVGEVLNEKYAFMLMIISTLLLVMAFTVDMRQKIGLYLLFKNKEQ